MTENNQQEHTSGLDRKELHKIRAVLYSSFMDCQLKATSTLTSEEQLILSQLKTLHKEQRHHHYLPSIPEVIQKLFNELDKEDVSMPTVLALIRQDQGISGNLIKMANSVYFNPSGATISTINHAISMVGLSHLRNLVMSVMLEDLVLTKTSFFRHFGRALWSHSLQTAHLCRLISRKEYASLDYESHYLLGLFYDSGKLVLLNMINKIINDNPGIAEPGCFFLYQILNRHGPALTVKLSQKWNIPEDLIQAMQEQEKMSLANLERYESKILFKARLLTSIHSLIKSAKLNHQQATELLEKEHISAKQFNRYFS